MKSRPLNRTVPKVMDSSPAIMRRVVVLPHPDGPSMVKNSSPEISKFTLSTATIAPSSVEKTLDRSVTARVLSGMFHSLFRKPAKMEGPIPRPLRRVTVPEAPGYFTLFSISSNFLMLESRSIVSAIRSYSKNLTSFVLGMSLGAGKSGRGERRLSTFTPIKWPS